MDRAIELRKNPANAERKLWQYLRLRQIGGDQVRKVQEGGIVHYRGREFRVGSAFRGYPVAIRETEVNGVFNVFFCTEVIAQFSLL